MRNKLFGVLMMLVLGTCVIPVKAAESAEVENELQKIYEDYAEDAQFQMMKSEYGEEYAQKYILDVAQWKQMGSLLRGGSGNICYQYVTNVMQTKTYNCGMTTVLQTLYGLNSADQVSGTTTTDKLNTLDSEYNVDGQGQTYVYQVRDALNKYSKSSANYPYIYEEATNMTLNEFEANIAKSLMYGKPVVLHAKTGQFSYYGGKDTGHYLSLDYVNRTNDVVRIVDCNYNTAYYGIHNNVSLQEAYNSIHATAGRYLIY